MISIKGTTITMTRGDTLKVKLNLTDESGEPYTPSDGDVIKVGVKADYSSDTFEIEKTIPNNTLLLHLQPSDTTDLDYGTYVWDAQITFANGDVNTFITKAKFKLTEEVV